MEFSVRQFEDLTGRENPGGQQPVRHGRAGTAAPRCGGDCATCPNRVLHRLGLQAAPFADRELDG